MHLVYISPKVPYRFQKGDIPLIMSFYSLINLLKPDIAKC